MGRATAAAVLLRDDVVLVARPVSGVLLRSDDGELPARPCARVSGLVRAAAASSSTTTSSSAVLERRGNQIHFNPRLLELAARIITSPHGLARYGPEIRKDAWSGPFALCAIRSGPAEPSPRWPNAIVRLCSGAMRWPTNGAGPTMRPPHRRRGLRRRTAPLAAAAAAPVLTPIGSAGALAQDHLRALRSQRLLDPAGSRGTPADPGRLRHRVRILDGAAEIARHHAAMTGTAGPRPGASAGSAADQAQSPRRHARRPPGASRSGERRPAGAGLRRRRIGRQSRPRNCFSCWISTAPPLCAAPSAKPWNAIRRAPLRSPSCCAGTSLHAVAARSQPASASSSARRSPS